MREALEPKRLVRQRFHCADIAGRNGEIEQAKTIAAGPSGKVRSFLRKTYGRGRWRYEAHGIGKRDFKIKDYLDKP